MSERRVEVQDARNGWLVIPFAELLVGMVFRVFTPEGEPLLDGDGVGRWRVTGRTAAGELETEQVPETEIERAVREDGIFWPGGEPSAGPPGKLR